MSGRTFSLPDVIAFQLDDLSGVKNKLYSSLKTYLKSANEAIGNQKFVQS